jgi:hypothetical protein
VARVGQKHRRGPDGLAQDQVDVNQVIDRVPQLVDVVSSPVLIAAAVLASTSSICRGRMRVQGPCVSLVITIFLEGNSRALVRDGPSR